MSVTPEAAIAQTQDWLERAVIGLNLCPFAKAVHTKNQIHWAVCEAPDAPVLLEALEYEIKSLLALADTARATTLLIAPNAFADFLDFNDFMAQADDVLDDLGLVGEIQLASFHPRYQFAGTAPDDITNYTNRAPYPTLHVLRESSIDQAVQSFPDAAAIYETNMRTLTALGHAGWGALQVGPQRG